MSEKVTPRIIPFGRPWITEVEKSAVLDVLSGDVLTHGPQAQAFEREFSLFMGDEAHCLTVSSGMAALHLAYWQLGIGPGDEVLVPAQTHVATVHAVEYIGAKPVFVDCDETTGNMDPRLIEELITSRTKGIGLVHFNGIPCEMDSIMGIAEQYGLKVIEDCALSVGSRYKGVHVGLIGDAAIFSFYPVKHITTGDGGMFVTRHSDLAFRVARARAFGVDRNFSERAIPGMYDVPTLGINYRMSDINAAIGRKQLERIETILERRKANFEVLKHEIKKIRSVRVLDSSGSKQQQSWYCLSAVITNASVEKRNAIAKRLNSMGVGTSIYYPQPVPRFTYYRNKYNVDMASYPNATRISDQSIALPVGPHLSSDDMNYVGHCFELACHEEGLE